MRRLCWGWGSMRRNRVFAGVWRAIALTLVLFAGPVAGAAHSAPLAQGRAFVNSADPPLQITPADQEPVDEASDLVARVMRAYEGYYGGGHWDATNKILYFYLANPPPGQADRRAEIRLAISDALQMARINVNVRYKNVPLSFEARGVLTEKVANTGGDWGGPSAGQHLSAVSIDPETGAISISVDGDLEALGQAAQRRFGPGVHVTLAPRPVRDFGRFDDTSPWTVGNAIWTEQYADRRYVDCTQGWNWRRQDGILYTSTAAHCAAAGVSIFHASTTQRIGYVSSRYRNDGGSLDHEFIRITYGALDATVWVGGPGTGDQRTVVDADNNGTMTGLDVCSSGAAGGLVCGEVEQVNKSITFTDGITTNGLTCVLGTYGYATQGGDSGGPWLRTHNDGTVKAWGQHVGSGNVPCITPSTNRHMFFSPVVKILG
jgi:hypothetical protein